MKDLPGDPLSYLINALRVIQDKKKRVCCKEDYFKTWFMVTGE